MYKLKVDEHGNILVQYRTPELTPVHNTTIDGFLWLDSPNVLDYKTNYWNGTAWATRTEAPEKWYIWTGSWVESQDLKDIIIGQTMIRIRLLRDTLLAQSDWTQVSDSPLTETDQTSWTTYRQTLRDFPATQVDVTDFEAIAWPTQPS
jgi:hypothetical protein